jgi:hypothetical protein
MLRIEAAIKRLFSGLRETDVQSPSPDVSALLVSFCP